MPVKRDDRSPSPSPVIDRRKRDERSRSPLPIADRPKRAERPTYRDSDPPRSENERSVPAAPIGRAGGVYLPPHKVASLKESGGDVASNSVAAQRISWEKLRKSLNGIVNKVNKENIVDLLPDLFRENLIRGRGLFARAVLRAQLASPGFSAIYAALLAVVNSKLPELGSLILRRCLLQFRKAYRRNDKIVCLACVKFMAHLTNQKIVNELLVLQLASLLLEKLTNDSVEICVHLIQEVGQVLQELCPAGFNAIFERLRSVLHEGTIDNRVQYIVERLFDVYRKRFEDFPGVETILDLVEESDQITHEIDLLEENVDGEEMLNIFQPLSPEEYQENESKWAQLSADILGTHPDGEHSDKVSVASSEDSEGQLEEEMPEHSQAPQQIRDVTEQDLVNLRKTIYLTIMSSASFEECVHKLMKMNIKEGCEIEVCRMLLDCCMMERTFQRFFAFQGQRLCALKQVYKTCFLECFRGQYETLHRLETNKLRNIAKFFAHLLQSGSIPWQCLEIFVLSEETTTAASRIFIKLVFQELAETMGLAKLHRELHRPDLQPYLEGLFPTQNPKNIRFAINYFTAIGLGALTDDLRETLLALNNAVSILDSVTVFTMPNDNTDGILEKDIALSSDELKRDEVGSLGVEVPETSTLTTAESLTRTCTTEEREELQEEVLAENETEKTPSHLNSSNSPRMLAAEPPQGELTSNVTVEKQTMQEITEDEGSSNMEDKRPILPQLPTGEPALANDSITESFFEESKDGLHSDHHPSEDPSLPAPSELEKREAEAYKNEGNSLLAKGDVLGAIRCYSYGIEKDSTNHIFYSNRCAAYLRAGEWERALQDAEHCVRLSPSFIKGHGRRAAALIALKRPSQAIEAVDLGLTSAGANNNVPEASLAVLRNAKNDAQKLLIRRALCGRWVGTVTQELGGYEQILNFSTSGQSDEAETLSLNVMGRSIPAKFVIWPNASNNGPLGIDISAIPDTPQAEFIPPPTVSYIMKFERKISGAADDEQQCNWEEYDCLSELESDSFDKYDWRLVLCAPFMTMQRPTDFTGPGLVTLKKLPRGIEGSERKFADGLLEMSFDEQLEAYCDKINALALDSVHLEEPEPHDSQEEAARKISRFMTYQTKVFSIGNEFPDSVSFIAESLLLNMDEEEPSRGHFKEIVSTFTEKTMASIKAAQTHIQEKGLNLVQFAVNPNTLADIQWPAALSLINKGNLSDLMGKAPQTKTQEPEVEEANSEPTLSKLNIPAVNQSAAWSTKVSVLAVQYRWHIGGACAILLLGAVLLRRRTRSPLATGYTNLVKLRSFVRMPFA